MPPMGQIGHPMLPSGSAPPSASSPQFGVAWEPRGQSLRENVHALLNGPWTARSSPDSDADSPSAPLYLGPSWIASLHARNALLASVLIHVVVLMSIALRPVPVPRADEPAMQSAHYELTWYPMHDLPRLSPPGTRRANISHTAQMAQPGADAYHPRQTILSQPMVPTHPRQTLIVPRAPLTAPKILPALPNVVQWSEVLPSSQPARPSLSARVSHQTPLLPTRDNQKPALPDIRAGNNPPGTLLFADATPVVPRPRLPVAPGGARPTAPVAPNRAGATPAPQIGGTNANGRFNQNWIALSAEPAPVPPPPNPPEGNLSARFSVSPAGLGHGSPDGGHEAGGGGPAGITIGGGNERGTGSDSGAASHAGSQPGIPPPSALAGRGSLHVLPGSVAPEPLRSAASRPPSEVPMASGLNDPEHVLKTKQFYTLFVNMPNLTSSAGSWVMNFAELDADGEPAPRREGLAGPVPLRKVDPKYPPDMVNEHVEGEVLLYAIIRADGSVDSVQIVKGIEPELDRNAMQALSRWKFRPALRNNQPVELEALVRIPFRYNPF